VTLLHRTQQEHFTQSIRYRHKIGGNSELATSGPENSSEKEMLSVLVGRWWATMQPVWLTADCSMPVERRQRMIGRPGLIAWQARQSELLWLTSAGDGGPRRQQPANTVSEAGRSCTVETAERQNTEAKPYPLWDAQPVEIAHIDTLYVRALKEICWRAFWKREMLESKLSGWKEKNWVSYDKSGGQREGKRSEYWEDSVHDEE